MENRRSGIRYFLGVVTHVAHSRSGGEVSTCDDAEEEEGPPIRDHDRVAESRIVFTSTPRREHMLSSITAQGKDSPPHEQVRCTLTYVDNTIGGGGFQRRRRGDEHISYCAPFMYRVSHSSLDQIGATQ